MEFGADPRAATNPIFNDNKFKLGLFCHNASVMQMSTAPEKYVPTWQSAQELAALSDRFGLEAIVSFAGWRGSIPNEPKHRSHREFETFSWCAAVGAVSRYPAVIATFHTQLTSPAFVAKACATIDHVSGGRAGLNVVAGSSQIAFNQFGLEIEDHVTRYDHTDEFIAVMKRFWSSEQEFDHDGRFLKVVQGLSWPKPVQRPAPPLVNAGISDRGRDFAARHADIAFTHMRGSEDDWRATIASYKTLAATQYQRPIQVWTHGHVVVGDTEAEANDYLRWYAEQHADKPWIDSWLADISENVPSCGRAEDQHGARLGGRRRPWARRHAGHDRGPASAAGARRPGRVHADGARADQDGGALRRQDHSADGAGRPAKAVRGDAAEARCRRITRPWGVWRRPAR